MKFYCWFEDYTKVNANGQYDIGYKEVTAEWVKAHSVEVTNTEMTVLVVTKVEANAIYFELMEYEA